MDEWLKCWIANRRNSELALCRLQVSGSVLEPDMVKAGQFSPPYAISFGRDDKIILNSINNYNFDLGHN